MRGAWRIRKALDRLEQFRASPASEEPPTEHIEPLLPTIVEPKPPKGLWMPKDQPWAYIVVPKSACTTIGQYLYYADRGYYYHADIHTLSYGLHKAGVDPAAVRRQLDTAGEDLFTFSFVRDPYARLVSAFLDKVLDLDQAYRKDIRDRLTSDWGVQLTGEKSQVENFKLFMRFVEYQYQKWEEFQQLKEGEQDTRAPWETVDIHWLRQSWYLRRGSRHAGQVHFIGAVETMNSDLEQITQHCHPPHNPSDQALPKFGMGPKRDSPLQAYYDDETKAIVDRYFSPDFQLLGYPKVVGGTPEQLTGFERAARFEASRIPAKGETQDTDDSDGDSRNE